MAKGFKKKDKYADLDNDFKAALDGADEATCRRKLSEIGINQNELMLAKKNDQDLADKTEIAKEAGAVYREGSKRNALATSYIVERLRNMGKI